MNLSHGANSHLDSHSTDTPSTNTHFQPDSHSTNTLFHLVQKDSQVYIIISHQKGLAILPLHPPTAQNKLTFPSVSPFHKYTFLVSFLPLELTINKNLESKIHGINQHFQQYSNFSTAIYFHLALLFTTTIVTYVHCT